MAGDVVLLSDRSQLRTLMEHWRDAEIKRSAVEQQNYHQLQQQQLQSQLESLSAGNGTIGVTLPEASFYYQQSARPEHPTVPDIATVHQLEALALTFLCCPLVKIRSVETAIALIYSCTSAWSPPFQTKEKKD